MDLSALLERLLHPLRQRVNGMVARGVMRLIDDAPAVQRSQLERRAGEVFGDAEVLWPPGLRAAIAGGEAIVLALGGSANHVVALPMGTKGGPDLAASEVALYGPGGWVHLKTNGELRVRATTKLVLRHGDAGDWISISAAGIRSSSPIIVAGGEP